MALSNLDRATRQILDAVSVVPTAEELRLRALATMQKTLGLDGALFRPGTRWSNARPIYIDAGLRFTDAYLANPSRYRRELEPWCRFSRGRNAFFYDDLYGPRERDLGLVYNEVLRPARVRHVMGAPVVFRGQMVGLMFLYRGSGARAFPRAAAETATALAEVFAIAEAAMGRTPPEAMLYEGRAEALPPRERQVATLFAEGLSSKEIAAVTGTSFHTVRKQIAKVFARLDVHDRRGLALVLRGAAGSTDG